MKLNTLIGMAVITAGAVSTANAQGGFVLFGESGQPLSEEQRFVRPLTAPYFHEDSFVTTDVRAWYVNHQFYGDTIGGDVAVYAVQVRIALTDRLQFVAYKDGYAEVSGSALGSPDGWNDLAAGLKYAFVQDAQSQFYLAGGVGYELGVGDDQVLQDTDELRLWVSANKGFGKLHLGVTANYRMAVDKGDGLVGTSDIFSVHAHADYWVTSWFSPVVEVNGYFVTDEGAPGLPFSGVDAVSVGGGQSEDTITAAIGAEFRPFGPEIGIRAAYEWELTDAVSLFGHRWTVSAVYEF